MTREPEWDDRQRNLMLALDAVEVESCGGCGLHPTITGDPSNVLMPDNKVCPVCMGLDRYRRIQKAQDDAIEEQISKDATPGYPRPDDGRTTYLRPATTAEIDASKKGGDPRGSSRRAGRPIS